MKHLMLVFLVIGATLIFFGCSEKNPTAPELSQSDQVTNTQAKKPSPNLIGTTNTPFNFPPLPDPGGSGLPIFWKGTIDFGEDTYGIYFLSYDAPRGYSQASPFYEDFVIHELGNTANVYLKGWNAGVVTYANNPPEPCQFLANGKVDEAYGEFEEWQGRNLHIKGTVYWNPIPIPGVGLIPEYAAGTLRIN
ncbi:MAG: hypothetical protein KJO12_07590 [Ignavibacteria bacterium]|nr:hypothetical protein [Ignavibacteria bacterium]